METKDISEPVDILTGGFPCQPYSVAGKQKGTDDNRYLWPDMFRVIKEVKPTFVIAENVRGIINIQNGMVFETVCSDLEAEGFEVQSFVIPAAGVGAPHKRERVWIVGYSKHNGSLTSKIERGNNKINDRTEKRKNTTLEPERTGRPGDNATLENARRELHERASIGKKDEDETREETTDQHKRPGSTSWGSWSSEPNVGRVADGVPQRAHRLRGLGNAIVPKIAEEIGRAIWKNLIKSYDGTRSK